VNSAEHDFVRADLSWSALPAWVRLVAVDRVIKRTENSQSVIKLTFVQYFLCIMPENSKEGVAGSNIERGVN
jgi:hypothetical protein